MDLDSTKIRILEGCLIHGEHVDRDEEPEVDTPTARMLVAIGKAILLPTATIQTRDPKAATRDPKAAK